MKLRKFLTHILLMICAIAALECILRIPWIQQIEHTLIQKSLWDHINDPNHPEALRFFTSRYDYDQTLGYIRRDIRKSIVKTKYAKPDYRILLIGDSVSETGSFPVLLETKLGQTFPDKKIDVVNLGTVGYETVREATVLQQYGLRYKPDMVILEINYNDFFETPVVMKNGGSWIALQGKRLNNYINPWLLNNSHIYRLGVISATLFRIRTAAAYHAIPDEHIDQNISTPLGTIVDSLQMRHIPFIIMIVPDSTGIPYALGAKKQLSRIINRFGLSGDTIFLDAPFEKEGWETMVYDAHPTQEGNILEADLLYQKVCPQLKTALRDETHDCDSLPED
jgi:hypothetical protein